MRIINAFFYSCQGLSATWQNEASFRLEIMLTLLVVPLVFYIGKNAIERAVLWFSWFLIPIIELVNSALETTVNRISTDLHPLSGMAKDIGSAAVFLTIVNAAIVWGICCLRCRSVSTTK